MIALRHLVFGGRRTESGLRVRVIAPLDRPTAQPFLKPSIEPPRPRGTALDRLYASQAAAQAMWYRQGGR